VFLVEDMKHMRSVLSEMFGALGGFELVASAATEAEAKLWLHEHPDGCDLAVVDLILEQGSGLGVIPRCKASGAARVAVLSDYATPGVRRHCLQLGADAVFQKADGMQAFMAWCGELGSPAVSGS
jgi:DNA-binding NarL/FixJ family response regulator